VNFQCAELPQRAGCSLLGLQVARVEEFFLRASLQMTVQPQTDQILRLSGVPLRSGLQKKPAGTHPAHRPVEPANPFAPSLIVNRYSCSG
jgi:hypothetical protein